MLQRIDAYWRAANYLSVGQIYLYDNPLLKRPLAPSDVKQMLLGHWGTTPGQNFIYAHLNRVIKKYDADMIYVAGPGHGGPAVVANTYLEGTYSEIYPAISQDTAGLQRLCRQFSFPGGIPSHASPECPGSIHEGGELGYSLSPSFGAAFDNPDLLDAINAGLKWISKAGKSQAIFAKYGLDDPAYFQPLSTDPRIGVDRDGSGKVLGPTAHVPKDFSQFFA